MRRLALIVPILLLAACGAQTAQPDTARPTSGKPAASAKGKPSPSSGATTTAQFGPDHGFKYDGGLKVSVLKAARTARSQYAAGGKPGQVVAKFSLRVTNGGTAPFDTSLVQVNLAAGTDGQQAEQVFDESLGVGFTGTVLPGRSKTAAYGFAVDKADLSALALEVTPGFEYSAVTFEGAAS